MNIKVNSKKENPLFARIELEALISYDSATPSRQQIGESLAHSLKVEKDALSIVQISQVFGSKTAKVKVNVYADVEALKKAEPIFQQKRHKLIEEKKVEPAK